MAFIVEPLKQDKKLNEIIEETKAKKVGVFLWHGAGDIIMFMAPFEKLKSLYPDVHFDLFLPKGLGQEDIYPNAVFVEADETKDFSGERFQEYDIIARINMPMNEGQTEYTKGEWCAIHELGISPVNGHFPPKIIKNKLVGCHFQITCLPDSANVPYDIAKEVWFEIIEAGFIPIETLMKHQFHNPRNEKYDFIDRHLREVKPEISTLAGMIKNCEAFICGVSGNFHLALGLLPPEKITLLERDFLAPSFTKLPINRIDVKNYEKGKIREWLLSLSSS